MVTIAKALYPDPAHLDSTVLSQGRAPKACRLRSSSNATRKTALKGMGSFKKSRFGAL